MNGANLPMNFDPSEYQPVMGGGNALPVSDKKGHLVVITDSDFKDNSKGTGKMLALTLHIQDGPHAGSEGDWNLNLGHPNATTVRIALNELSCICHAVGHTGPLNNAGVLHNKPFRVVVTAQNSDEGKEKGYTNVTKVLRADGSKLTDPPGSGGAPQPTPAPPAPPAPAAASAAAPASFPVTTGVQPQGPPAQPQQPPQAWPAQAQQAPPQAAAQPQQWSPQSSAEQPPAPQQPQPGAVPPWGAPPQ